MSNSETPSPTRQLPSRPSIEQLSKQAKELLRSVRAAESEAITEVRTFERDPDLDNFKLTDAQRILARAYGLLSWRQLRRHIDSLDINEFCQAVSRCDVNRVRELAGARPELVDIDRGDEQIALHIPVLAQDAEMTALLMELGSDARRGFWPHREATSAHAIAKERGYTEILQIIEDAETKRTDQVVDRAESSSASPSEERDATASKEAVIAGDLDGVHELHQAGRLVNKIDFYQGGLLSIAVRNNDFKMLKLLIECELDIDERTREPVGNGYNHSWGMPLWNSSCNGRHEMAKWLIAHGCDVNAVVYACGDALSNADEAMRQLLLEAGARVTVEHVAGWRDIELANRIIAGTAPVQSLNSDATQSGDGNFNPEIIDCFLWTATYNAVPEIVKRCLDTIDWPIDAARWHYILMQPFRFANVPKNDRTERLRRDCFYCLKLLLEHGVNPDVTMNGNTVLHHLATSEEPTETDRIEFAKILLDAGASLTLRDTGTLRSTPLGWACRWGRIELVRLYLQRGAPAEEPDAEEWATPLARAKSNGHAEIADLVKKHAAE